MPLPKNVLIFEMAYFGVIFTAKFNLSSFSVKHLSKILAIKFLTALHK